MHQQAHLPSHVLLVGHLHHQVKPSLGSSGLKLNRIEVEGLGGLVGSGFSFFFQVGGRSFECLPKSAPNSAVSTENTDAEACHTAAPHCI